MDRIPTIHFSGANLPLVSGRLILDCRVPSFTAFPKKTPPSEAWGNRVSQKEPLSSTHHFFRGEHVCVWGGYPSFFSNIGCFQQVPLKTFPHVVGADEDDESHGIESVKITNQRFPLEGDIKGWYWFIILQNNWLVVSTHLKMIPA